MTELTQRGELYVYTGILLLGIGTGGLFATMNAVGVVRGVLGLCPADPVGSTLPATCEILPALRSVLVAAGACWIAGFVLLGTVARYDRDGGGFQFRGEYHAE